MQPEDVIRIWQQDHDEHVCRAVVGWTVSLLLGAAFWYGAYRVVLWVATKYPKV